MPRLRSFLVSVTLLISFTIVCDSFFRNSVDAQQNSSLGVDDSTVAPFLFHYPLFNDPYTLNQSIKRTLVFSINTGHSGSTSLAFYLNELEGVTAFHESLRNITLRETVRDGYKATYAQRKEILVPFLLRKLNSPPFSENPNEIYVETTQDFSSLFYDVLLDYFHVEHGDEYEVIIINLRRQYACVARSWFSQVANAPQWSEYKSSNYLTAVGAQYNVLHAHISHMAKAPEAQEEPMDAIIGYVLDHEAAIVDIHNRYPEVKMVDLRIEEVKELEVFEDLLHQIGVEDTQAAMHNDPKKFAERFLGRKFNGHIDIEKDDPIITKAFERMDKFLKYYKDHNLELPPLPALNMTFRFMTPEEQENYVRCT